MSRTVVIAGGGLAGLSLGVALRRKAIPVELHEAGVYPRHRVCGEFICGVDGQILRALGIDDLFSDAVPCQTTGWFYRGYNVYRKQLPQPALGISRKVLDLRLAQRFRELGGYLREQSRLGEDALLHEGTICATGRKAGGNDWLGLKFHVHRLDLDHDLELHFGSGAYLGLARIEGGAVNACGLFQRRPGVTASRSGLPFAYLEACGLGYLLDRFSAAQVDPDSVCGVAALAYGRRGEAMPGVLAVGDHAGLIPPFTGNGMSMAFESAALALEPLRAWSEGELDWPTARARVMALQRKAFKGRRRIAGLLHPMLYRPAGQRALSLFARSRLLPFTPLFKLTH